MNTPLRNDNATGQGRAVDTANQTSREFIYPAHNTQPARLLAALLTGRRIHPLDGWRSLGIYRLSDTVLQLRKLGWPVVTDRLDVTNRFNEACHVALYSLPNDSIDAAGLGGLEW